MRFSMLRQRLRYSIGGVIAIGMFAALASWQHIVANGPTKADEQLASEVEVNVPRFLRVAGRHTYSIKVTIKSKSAEPLPGPIYLVVQGTGIDGLTAENADAQTAADEPYIRFLSETDTLLPGKSSVSRTIRFKSDKSLRPRERRQFKLDYRLTRDVARAKEKKASRDRRPQRSRRVSSRGTGLGNRGSRNGNRPPRNGNKDLGDNPDAGDRANNSRPEPYVLKEGITNKQIKRVMKIQDAWTQRLMKKAGVRGTSTGVNATGDLVIRVYTSRHGIAKNLPETIEGIPVETRVVGRIRSLFQPPQDKRGNAGRPRQGLPEGGFLVSDFDPPVVDDPQQRFDRPVPIGVSGINVRSGCATGTIGCRLKGSDGTLYALSNNHVFADENGGSIGDDVVQPGPLDNVSQCLVDLEDSIGTLAAFQPIFFNNFLANNRVDAGIALVTSATVGKSTPRGAYGTPNSHVVEPLLGMKVQKMGRTTSHTTGRITGVNVAIAVGYAAGVGFFTGQMEITSPILRVDQESGEVTISLELFGGPGDSGSLVVTNYGNNPVGLLYAGSLFFIFANPIDEVLERMSQQLGQSLTIDGSTSNAAPVP